MSKRRGGSHNSRVAIKDMSGSPSDPLSLIKQIDWPLLEHAYGPAEDTPSALSDLLNGPPEAQARALGHLTHAVHHQNSVYTATPPAALYVAAILSDPRTDTLISRERNSPRCPLRQALLDWLESVAGAVGKDTEATWLRFGFSPDASPAFVRTRAIRPVLFDAVSAFFHEADLAVREAAVAAAVPLLDAPELTRHQGDLAPLVRNVLATSSNRIYRAIAKRGLTAWEEEPLVEQGKAPGGHAEPEREPWISGEPPF